MKTIVICSGGLDSVSLAYKIAQEQQLLGLVSFNYNQRHVKEIEFAAQCARALKVPHHLLDLKNCGAFLTGSALTDSVAVPDGHYTEDTMRLTVVPNRNAIMLAIAFGVAAAQKADAVALAVHGGDHFIYPDCRPEFIQAFARMQQHALEGYANIELLAPYVNYSKADIVAEGARYGTPFKETWSCYKGQELHCGRCGTCVERQEAFALAGIEDPTCYEDPSFWKQTCQKFSVIQG